MRAHAARSQRPCSPTRFGGRSSGASPTVPPRWARPAGAAGVSKPAVTKHLQVLEDPGIVNRVVRGRTHVLTLRAHQLADAAAWIDRQRRLWEPKLEIITAYLEETS